MIRDLISSGWRPDLIHAQSFFPAGVCATEIYKEFNIPFVLTEHSTIFSRNMLSDFKKDKLKYVLKSAKEIIAVSNGLKSDVIKYTSKEIAVIPNMVDCDTFLLAEKNSKPGGDFIFLSLGYLTYKKGFDVLLDAFSLLLSMNPNVILRIGGAGDQESKLKKKALELGIQKNVIFLGKLERKDVIKEMNDCDSFVLASRHETFGVVFIEALLWSNSAEKSD